MLLVLLAACALFAVLGAIGLAILLSQPGEPAPGPAPDNASPPTSPSNPTPGTSGTSPSNPTPGTSGTSPSNPAPNAGEWRGATMTCFYETKNFAAGGTDPTKMNVVAVLAKDFDEYKGKRLELKLPTGTHTVEVRDLCAASSPECTRNAQALGNNFLLDINHLALQRLWPSKKCENTYESVQFRKA